MPTLDKHGSIVTVVLAELLALSDAAHTALLKRPARGIQ